MGAGSSGPRCEQDGRRCGARPLALTDTPAAIGTKGKASLATGERGGAGTSSGGKCRVTMELDALGNAHSPRPTRAGMNVVGCAVRCSRAEGDAYWCH